MELTSRSHLQRANPQAPARSRHPSVRQDLYRPHVPHELRRRAGLARSAASCPTAPCRLDPSAMVLPLRPGGLRGHEGLPHARRQRPALPSHGKCAAAATTPASACASPRLTEEFSVEAVKALVMLWSRTGSPPSRAPPCISAPLSSPPTRSLGVHACPQLSLLHHPAARWAPTIAEGINPVKIYVEDEDVRAVRGGTGYTKCGGNYAASIRAGERGRGAGLRPGAVAGRRRAQVYRGSGHHERHVQDGRQGRHPRPHRLRAARHHPHVLPGAAPGLGRQGGGARLSPPKSCLTPLRAASWRRPGAPAPPPSISPIGELAMGRQACHRSTAARSARLTQKLYDTLTGIQWGTEPDPYGWTVPVE